MLQTIASGYIKRSKKLPKNRNITEQVAQYTGDLKLGKKQIMIEIYTGDENIKDKQIFIKLSQNVNDDIYGII